jgi:hypothetical protein
LVQLVRIESVSHFCLVLADTDGNEFCILQPPELGPPEG